MLVSAQEEARKLDHNLGTEHLLLGLLHVGLGGGASLTLGYNHDDVRATVEAMVGRARHRPAEHLPFTPRAKKVLELSLREALQLKHNYIGTEHILLGLLREGEGIAAQILVSRHPLDRIRGEVLAQLESPGAREARRGPYPGGATCWRCCEARRRGAGRQPPHSGGNPAAAGQCCGEGAHRHEHRPRRARRQLDEVSTETPPTTRRSKRPASSSCW